MRVFKWRTTAAETILIYLKVLKRRTSPVWAVLLIVQDSLLFSCPLLAGGQFWTTPTHSTFISDLTDAFAPIRHRYTYRADFPPEIKCGISVLRISPELARESTLLLVKILLSESRQKVSSHISQKMNSELISSSKFGHVSLNWKINTKNIGEGINLQL